MTLTVKVSKGGDWWLWMFTWRKESKLSQWNVQDLKAVKIKGSRKEDVFNEMVKKSRQSADKFAYKVHPIHFHESEKCQALEFQIVWLYTVAIYFTCMWLFGLLCNILDCDTVNYAWLCLIVHFPLWESGGLAPCFLNLATRWRWVVSIGLQLFYPWDKSSWSGLDVVLQNKSTISKGSKPKFSCSPAHNLVTVMAELR